MFTVASSTAALGTMFTDTGTIILYAVTAILAGTVALLGLGFGVRHAKKYLTGKKF